LLTPPPGGWPTSPACTTCTIQGVTSANLSDDATPELIAWNANGFSVMASDTGITFGQVKEYEFANPKRIAFADFDGNGLLDIVLASPTNGVAIFLTVESGDPVVAQVTFTNSPEPSRAWAVATGDVNGDDITDLVVGWEENVSDAWKSRISVLFGQE
jgi:hypothetical protein